eukprot:6148398-Ditylum_brightwellii.AAC.1
MLAVMEASYGTEDLENLCYDTQMEHDSGAGSDPDQELGELEDTWQYVHPPTSSDQVQLQTEEKEEN